MSAPSLNLVSAVTSSSVLQAQHEQQLQQRSTRTGPAHARAVLDVLLQHWHTLMQERLLAAQMLLPDIPLVCAARTDEELASQHLGGVYACAAGPSAEGTGVTLCKPQSCSLLLPCRAVEDVEAWRQIGHRHSPWVLGLEAAPACIKLMYAADDLLHALMSTTVTCSDVSAAEHVQLTLLQGVRAPSRVWLQSFFAELHPSRRQVCMGMQAAYVAERQAASWLPSAEVLSQASSLASHRVAVVSALCSHVLHVMAPQVGLDDVLHTWYAAQQVQQAHSIAASCSAAACRTAARTGVPASARPWVWAAALGLHACPPPDAGRSSSCQGGESSSKDGTGGSFPAASTKQDAWWHIPNQRDLAKLELLCNAVKQQVCRWVSSTRAVHQASRRRLPILPAS
jgi:hypothetical protein